MKSNEKGFSVVEILLLLAVVGLIGGVSYYVFSKQVSKKAETNNSTNSPASNDQQDKLDEIKDKIGQLDHRDANSESFSIKTKLTDPAVSVFFPANFGFLFNASIYATNKDIAPVGSQGPNGSGINQAIQRDKVDSILKDSGLTKLSTDGTEPHVTVYYENPLVLCNVTDSIGVARVVCSSKQALNNVVTDVKSAFVALKHDFPSANTTQYSQLYYTESVEADVKGININELSGIKNGTYGAYLVNTSGSWQYIASNTAGQQSQISPSCDLIAKPEYKEVFKDYYGRTC